VSETKIEWAHYTFNPWWGCTKISDGCKNCYAEKLSNRFGGGHWGDHGDRKFFGDDHWKKPLKWQRKAQREGRRLRVFCASMGDIFERHPQPTVANLQDESRMRLWRLIAATPDLDWLLLTKRPENIQSMMPASWQGLQCPKNVWLGVTAENQEEVDRRVPSLLLSADWAPVRFVSYEPALGPVGLGRLLRFANLSENDCTATGIDWVIAGAESGPRARPMDESWVRSVRDECAAADVPFFYKQKLQGRRKVSLPQLDGVCHAAVPRGEP
jgi:protein gp37